jgi:hypothetical protein
MRIRTGSKFAFAALALLCSAIGFAGAQPASSPNTIPTTINICETALKAKNCGTLTWNGQQYDAQWSGVKTFLTHGPATSGTVMIRFESDGSVILERTDTAGLPPTPTIHGKTVDTTFTGTYRGKIAPDNSVSGSVTWYTNGIISGKGTWDGTVTMPAPKPDDPPKPDAPSTATSTTPSVPPIQPPPPPPDQPSVAPIAVLIDSTPPGADIEIDGAFVGSTPSTVNVAAGSHDIAVKKEGFTDWTKKLSVTGGNIHLSAELKAVKSHK